MRPGHPSSQAKRDIPPAATKHDAIVEIGEAVSALGTGDAHISDDESPDSVVVEEEKEAFHSEVRKRLDNLIGVILNSTTEEDQQQRPNVQTEGSNKVHLLTHLSLALFLRYRLDKVTSDLVDALKIYKILEAYAFQDTLNPGDSPTRDSSIITGRSLTQLYPHLYDFCKFFWDFSKEFTEEPPDSITETEKTEIEEVLSGNVTLVRSSFWLARHI